MFRRHTGEKRSAILHYCAKARRSAYIEYTFYRREPIDTLYAAWENENKRYCESFQ